MVEVKRSPSSEETPMAAAVLRDRDLGVRQLAHRSGDARGTGSSDAGAQTSMALITCLRRV